MTRPPVRARPSVEVRAVAFQRGDMPALDAAAESCQDLIWALVRRGFAHVESGPLVRSSYHAHEHVPAKVLGSDPNT